MQARVIALATLCMCLFFVVSSGVAQESSPLAASAGKGKLGYGFAPGLVPGKDFVAGQLIVGLKEGMSTRGLQNLKQTATAMQGTVVREIQGSAFLLEFASEQAVLDAVSALTALPEVAFVERNGFMRIPTRPVPPQTRGIKQGQRSKGQQPREGMQSRIVSADAGTGYQWHHTVIRKTATLPALVAAPPTVAVLDTGVDYTHTDLTGKVILGRNVINQTMDPFDDEGHGTHVAGIIAARAGNRFYGEGVCPNCRILAVKVLDSAGSGSFFDIAQGMSYVLSVRNTTTPRTRVVNMSLGGPNSALVAARVLAMRNAGLVLAVAAGNDNTTSTSNAFPGADPNTALRVMATEENDARTFFSNFSPAASPTQYNIAAPGGNIFSTVPGEGFTEISGTSQATPVVAGAAALVLGQFPALTREQLVTRLITNGKPISKGFAATTRRVDVRRAITPGTSETALVGRLLDPFTGLATSPPTTPDNARLFNGATQLATDATNRGGSYEMTGLAAGAGRILRANRANYVTSPLRSPLTVTAGIAAGPFTDAHPLARPAGFATVIVDWLTSQPNADTPGCINACNGWDFDLYVRPPSGPFIGISNPGDLATAPFVRYARDSIDDMEPLETIVIGASAANGVYRVFVNNGWAGNNPSFNPSWTGSLASAQIYRGATLFQNYAIHPATCGANAFWHVGNLTKNGANYTWTNVNTCSNVVP